MGGRAAEELIFGHDNITTGASGDFQTAIQTARAMVTKWGMSEKIGFVSLNQREWRDRSEEYGDEVDDEVREVLRAAYDRAMKVLKEHEKELHLLAEALVERETLGVEEVKIIIGGKCWKI